MANLCFGAEAMGCGFIYIGAVVIFFIAAVFRRQVCVNILDVNYDLIWATLIGLLVYFPLVIFLPTKWAFFLGMLAAITGGFMGLVFPLLSND